MTINAKMIKPKSLNKWRLAPYCLLLMFSTFAFEGFSFGQQDPAVERVLPVKRPVPTYPKYAAKNRVEGAVLVSYSIEKDGGVSDIEVEKSDQDELFDAVAKLAVQKWVFMKPTKKMRNNFVSFEFVLSNNPKVTKFANVEIIKIKAE